ncbi:DUF1592 domain-containing protein [Telmatocola sphagniphila]|uniref:DUF1592 domain-containing protein n=1 Tax=Telmatocola sphagniphila TaxID=1123043 RepID=A0A8E6EUV0_9BACT|nr:DUF1592 domain-containing protein [Telmatocola sphagniphila]QVL34129.1 DUF1592 domain-containing protein [Telmatocola sphagniphila]
MKTLTIVILLAFALSTTDGQEKPIPLEAAKDLGRTKSRYLKENKFAPDAGGALPKANLADFKKSVEPLLTKTCLSCHGPQKSKGRLRIDQLNPDLVSGADAERWREVYNVLSKSEMPPENDAYEALSPTNRGLLTDWLSEELNKASVVRRNSKEHSSFRRLAKYEYDYALQDLLGLPYSLANQLPPESTTEDGFKNSSELLQISGMQFELYREIALKALKRATVSGVRPKSVTYILSMQQEMTRVTAGKNVQIIDKGEAGFRKFEHQMHLLNRDTGKGIHYSPTDPVPLAKAANEEFPAVSPVVLVLPAGNELKLNLDRFLPDEGTMRVSIRAARSTMNPDAYASLRLLLSAHTSNDANFSQVISPQDVPVTASDDKFQWIHFDVPLSDIQRNPFRKLTTTFPRRDEFLHIRNISNAAGRDKRLQVLIDHIQISAPFYEQWPPKTHTDIFMESKNKSNEGVYGREVLNHFLRRAWHRPVNPQEVDELMALFAKYRPEFPTFEEAMVEVLATALAAPEFLYLTQRAMTDDKKPTTRISELELASRLSVFLWSSIPDEELLKLAEQGQLRKPEVLMGQVNRMLADARAKRFSQNFVEQWLGLDGLNSVTHIPAGPLKEAIREEPIAFFEEVLSYNRSIFDFLHSDYAVVNEPLAAHYGIPKVYGPHFRKVPITPAMNRGGLLTGAAILAMNSDGKDSHPLKRGVWMLKRILLDPPPPPPPDVPVVDLTNPEILKMTLKERIEDHRNKAACASCHSRIDPWGIAFENYDALGIYRTQIKNKPVDATSELFNKQVLAGMDGLKRYLLMERQDQFARAIVQKLTAYGLGRPLTFGDRSDIDQLTAEFRRSGDGLNDLIHQIVKSNLFNSK